MRVYRSPEAVPPGGRAVAIGTFDGLHTGHRQVIKKAIDRAQTTGLPSSVITFEPHPRAVINPDKAPKLITPLSIKADLIDEMGVDELIIIPFDRKLAQLEAAQFYQRILVDALGVTFMATGTNFHFGHGAKGDVRYLQERQRLNGIEAVAVNLVEVDGVTVSSSLVREMIAKGDISRAARLLCHRFQLEGTVVRGDGRGRELGVATANIVPDDRLCLPATGIYAATAAGVASAVSIGVRPTFTQSKAVIVEAHLIGHDLNLYGQTLRIAFIERLRDEVKFDSVEELVGQMKRDIEQVRELSAEA